MTGHAPGIPRGVLVAGLLLGIILDVTFAGIVVIKIVQYAAGGASARIGPFESSFLILGIALTIGSAILLAPQAKRSREG
ncbi:hypothetical protein J2Y69_002157 [Microbacterium resistens]|uniref:Uncharacterized protein n=1 Tax=Microbacterium resistens TaxID=156977 RepID=A0ABU1SD74_9MICO|nr:hypothetical protein [Microbacterium resistens]MDR6867553.1 hypothetical protein [Microbacterium resistens]